MSVWDLKVTLYIFFSIGTAIFLVPKLLKDNLSVCVILFWLLAVPFLTIIKTPVVTISFIAASLTYLYRRSTPPQVLFIFVALLGAVPTWFSYVVDIGGSTLFVLEHWTLLVLFLLVPLLPSLLHSKLKFNEIDYLFFAFVLFLCVHYLFLNKSLNFTTSLRSVIELLLYHFVTYIVISQVIIKYPKEAILNLLYGFLLLGVIISGVFVFNQILQADLYHVHSDRGNVYGWHPSIYRNGILRTEGPLIGEIMGMLLAATAGAVFLLRKLLGFSLIKTLLLLSLFGVVVILSTSRGVFFTFILSGTIFFFFKSQSLIRLFLLLVGIVVSIVHFSGAGIVQDEYGTFDFRAQLFEASFRFIKENPFGDPDFLSSHYFEHLRRGSTGFLDVVSTYLVYLLPMGYVGLVLYVAPFLITVFRLIIKVLNFNGHQDFKDILYFLIALIIGYLFMIGTASDVGLIGLMGLIFMSIGRGVVGVLDQAK